MLPPPGILLQIGYAAAISAAALILGWRWRERGWPVPVALGLGVAACHVVWKGAPTLWPVDRADRLFHLALLGAGLGVAESVGRIPAPARWAARATVAAGASWALLLPADPPWKVGAVAGGFFAAWSALAWRAARVEGPGVAAVLVVVAGAGGQALAFARSAFLGQMAGALAAAAVPLVLLGFVRRRPMFALGGTTAFALAALPLWICGWRLAKLPLESAALLAVAPVAAQRRWWVGALVAAAAAGFAAYVSHAANPSSPW